MKKKLVIFFISLFLLCPFIVNAKDKYKQMNLKETLKDEGIEISNKKYKESDKKVNIYFFRGKGCKFCKGFLEYLNDNLDQDGKYYNLVSYEVWNNKDNLNLLKEILEIKEQDFSGVPVIFVGDKMYNGFLKSDGEEIFKEVKKEYNKKEKSNILKVLEHERKVKRVNDFIGSGIFTITLFIIILVVLVITIIKLNKVVIYLNNEIDLLKNKIVLLENNSKEKDKEKIKNKQTIKKKTTTKKDKIK